MVDVQHRSELTGRIVESPSVRLDDVVQGTVALVKIDVEGAEDRVLHGMQRILRECRPAVIVECLPEGPNRAIEDIFRGHRYRIAHLTDQGVVPVDRIVPDPRRRHRNFLFVAED
jgi:hypothetical protein